MKKVNAHSHTFPDEVPTDASVEDTDASTEKTDAPVRKLLVENQLSNIVPYSRSHIWRLEQEGSFPKRIKIGQNRVAWLASEIDEWIEAKILARTSNIAKGDSR